MNCNQLRDFLLLLLMLLRLAIDVWKCSTSEIPIFKEKFSSFCFLGGYFCIGKKLLFLMFAVMLFTNSCYLNIVCIISEIWITLLMIFILLLVVCSPQAQNFFIYCCKYAFWSKYATKKCQRNVINWLWIIFFTPSNPNQT